MWEWEEPGTSVSLGGWGGLPSGSDFSAES